MTPAAGESRPPAWHWLAAAALLVTAFAIYWPALRGDWLWDDRADVVSNPLLRDAEGLRRIWFEPAALPDYYPIKASVQWVQWQLWGAHTLGYHLTNVVLHVLSALLIWRLCARLGLRHGWFGAVLFVVHPIMVESVAWIAELKNTLSLPPLLGACLALIEFVEHRRTKDYVRALALFVVAMLCKTSVVMLPCVLLLYVWWRHGRFARADLVAAVPFFIVSLLLGLVTVWLQQTRAIGAEILPLGGPTQRVAIAGAALAFYFWKCVWPAALMPIYPHAPIEGSTAVDFVPWLAFAVFAFVASRRWSTWGRHALLGGGWFALHLLPFLGFVPISYFRFTWVMDHFVYMPIIGLIGLVVAAADTIAAGLGRHGRVVAAIAVGVTAFALAAVSHRYAGIYRDAISLWGFAVKQNPAAWPAHNNLGFALAQADRPQEALAAYETALRLKPEFADARNNLGTLLLNAGQPKDAAAHFLRAIAVRPGDVIAHNNLGVALRRMRQFAAALPHFTTALELKPDYAEAWNNLGNTLRDLGRPAEAVPKYEQAIRVAPAFAEAYYNLGLALADLGRLDEAGQRIAEARRLNPALPPPRF
jgi:protein O-mannosyl-transferase